MSEDERSLYVLVAVGQTAKHTEAQAVKNGEVMCIVQSTQQVWNILVR